MTMTGSALTEKAQNVNWLLEQFVDQTAGVEQAVGVSADGLLMAMFTPLDRGEADKLGATISALTTLAQSATRMLNKGAYSQVIVEFQGGYLLVSSINARAAIGVVTGAGCDLGLIGYETTLLVERVGELLTPELITELKTSLLL